MSKKVVVKSGTKAWFGAGQPSVAEFLLSTPVEVEGPVLGGWYKTIGDLPGFPAGKRVFLTEDMFDDVPDERKELQLKFTEVVVDKLVNSDAIRERVEELYPEIVTLEEDAYGDALLAAVKEVL